MLEGRAPRLHEVVGMERHPWLGGEPLVYWSVANESFVELESVPRRHGHYYYLTVRCTNLAGLATYSSSDGMLVDTTSPVPGKVCGTGVPIVDTSAADGHPPSP